MRRRRLLAPLCLALACAGPRPSAPAGRSPARVRLLEPGASPRAALRHAAGAAPEALQTDLGAAVTLAVGDLAPPEVRSPVVRLSLRLGKHAADEARISVVGTVERIEVLPEAQTQPGMAQAVAADLEPLAGATFAAVYSTQGLLERADLPPLDATPQLTTTVGRLRDGLRVLLPPLPLEPVGPGARWVVRAPATVGAAAVEETAEYTLAERTADGARLTLKVTLAGGGQTLTVPGLPPGARVTLDGVQDADDGGALLRPGHLVHPAERRWQTTATGTTQPAGQPPARLQMAARTTVAVRQLGAN